MPVALLGFSPLAALFVPPVIALVGEFGSNSERLKNLVLALVIAYGLSVFVVVVGVVLIAISLWRRGRKKLPD